MVLLPVGPLPASTYWRRRLMLLVGLLALVLVARSCVGDGPSTQRAGSTPSPTPSVGATTSTSPSARPSPTRAGPVSCADRVLTLAVATALRSYPAGSTIRFTLTATNTGGAACRRDLGGGALEVLVYSGADRIWSSDDCGTDKSVSVQTLPARGSLESSVSWAGKRSARGCPEGRPGARPGTYTVRARVGTLKAPATVFRLTG